MAARSKRSRSARRRNRRYIGTLVLFVALIGGWSWFWHYAAGKAEVAIDGWRAREAKAGRVYKCGSQSDRRLSVPHRGELRQGVRAVAHQPAAGRDQGRRHVDRRADLPAESADHRIPRARSPSPIRENRRLSVANWKLAQSSVRGTPAAPERVSMALDRPVVDRIDGGGRHESCCTPSTSKSTAASSPARSTDQSGDRNR